MACAALHGFSCRNERHRSSGARDIKPGHSVGPGQPANIVLIATAEHFDLVGRANVYADRQVLSGSQRTVETVKLLGEGAGVGFVGLRINDEVVGRRFPPLGVGRSSRDDGRCGDQPSCSKFHIPSSLLLRLNIA